MATPLLLLLLLMVARLGVHVMGDRRDVVCRGVVVVRIRGGGLWEDMSSRDTIGCCCCTRASISWIVSDRVADWCRGGTIGRDSGSGMPDRIPLDRGERCRVMPRGRDEPRSRSSALPEIAMSAVGVVEIPTRRTSPLRSRDTALPHVAPGPVRVVQVPTCSAGPFLVLRSDLPISGSLMLTLSASAVAAAVGRGKIQAMLLLLLLLLGIGQEMVMLQLLLLLTMPVITVLRAPAFPEIADFPDRIVPVAAGRTVPFTPLVHFQSRGILSDGRGSDGRFWGKR